VCVDEENATGENWIFARAKQMTFPATIVAEHCGMGLGTDCPFFHCIQTAADKKVPS
jgi:hypothetical protein